MKEYEQFKKEAEIAAQKPPEVIEKIVYKDRIIEKIVPQKETTSSLDLISTDEYNQKKQKKEIDVENMDSSIKTDNNTEIDFNLTNSNNLPTIDLKESSNKNQSSFRDINDRDENFDTSLNSAFLNNVILTSTDDSQNRDTSRFGNTDAKNMTKKTLVIDTEESPIKEDYVPFDPNDDESNDTRKSVVSDKRRSSLKNVKTSLGHYLKNYQANFSRPVDDLWAEADQDKNNCLDREEAKEFIGQIV